MDHETVNQGKIQSVCHGIPGRLLWERPAATALHCADGGTGGLPGTASDDHAEGPVLFSECVEDPLFCERAEGCPTLPVWTYLTRGIDQVLDSITLQDIIQGKEPDSLRFGEGKHHGQDLS